MKRGHFAQSLISQYSAIKINFLTMSNFVLLATSTKNLEPLAHRQALRAPKSISPMNGFNV